MKLDVSGTIREHRLDVIKNKVVPQVPEHFTSPFNHNLSDMMVAVIKVDLGDQIRTAREEM